MRSFFNLFSRCCGETGGIEPPSHSTPTYYIHVGALLDGNIVAVTELSNYGLSRRN